MAELLLGVAGGSDIAGDTWMLRKPPKPVFFVRFEFTLLHTQEVTGSSPVAPTVQTKRLLGFDGGRYRCHKGGVSG